MKATLIMLPQPILVSDERIKIEEVSYHHSKGLYKAVTDGNYTNQFKVIAGIEGKPKLDLSAIAEEIGWVDVEKLALQQYPVKVIYQNDLINAFDINFEQRLGFIEGFKAAQSLNEKKYSLSEMEGFTKWLDENWRRGKGKKGSGWFHVGDFYKQSKPIMTKDLMGIYIHSISKPKEYQVEVEMDCTLVGLDLAETCTPRITNNTIKVVKVL